MRSLLLTALLALTSATALASEAAAGSGAPPPFALRDFEGKIVTLESFRGASPVLVVFYRGHW